VAVNLGERIDGPGQWSVWRARGDITERQIAAKNAGCIAFADQHLNASTSPKAQGAEVIVPDRVDVQAAHFAACYLDLVTKRLGVRSRGIRRGGPGAGNVSRAGCPGILVEPCFLSDPEFAPKLVTGEVLDALGWCLAESIRRTFEPGLVALSAGHAFRRKRDPGAVIRSEEIEPAFRTEAALNILIVECAEQMLLSGYGEGDEP
jgi:hypothetical protein